MPRGIFVVSLDFELFWGVRDNKSLEEYRNNLLGVRKAIPALLDLFQKYGIHATWATVGFLFFSEKQELLAGFPLLKPTYNNEALSPYRDLDTLEASEHDDPYHYGKSLIDLILKQPGQELGSHTFSHYYCLEPGQTCDSFRSDLAAAQQAAEFLGVRLYSLVFPRNQTNTDYLQVCSELGFTCYRGNQESWLYAKGSSQGESNFKRALRLLDSYVNLSGHGAYSIDRTEKPVNIRASQFLRPCNTKLGALNSLRLRRINNGMTRAAQTGQAYHLWWHPHNFGINLKANLKFLECILEHHSHLKKRFGMESRTMSEAANG